MAAVGSALYYAGNYQGKPSTTLDVLLVTRTPSPTATPTPAPSSAQITPAPSTAGMAGAPPPPRRGRSRGVPSGAGGYSGCSLVPLGRAGHAQGVLEGTHGYFRLNRVQNHGRLESTWVLTICKASTKEGCWALSSCCWVFRLLHLEQRFS